MFVFLIAVCALSAAALLLAFWLSVATLSEIAYVTDELDGD